MPERQSTPSVRGSARLPQGALICGLALLGSLLADVAKGQQSGFGEPAGTYPSPVYYQALRLYQDGNLEDALIAFDAAKSRTRLEATGLWIDSIPVLAMEAECLWQIGDLQSCGANLDRVMQIARDRVGWLRPIDWRDLTQNGGVRSQPQWLWPAAAAIQVAPLSPNLPYQQGSNVERTLRTGGTVEPNMVRSIGIPEIMRGLAIASYRRRVLLGPLAKDDPLALAVLENTKPLANLEAPAKILIGAMRTPELFGISDDGATIQKASGHAFYQRMAHPLSAVVGLTQAAALVRTGKSKQAVPIALQTAHTAGALRQHEMIGPAIRLAAGAADDSNAQQVAQTAQLIAKSLARESRLAAVECLLAACDASLTAGQAQQASTLLGNATSMLLNRSVQLPRAQSYRNYLAARVEALKGQSVGLTQESSFDQAVSEMTQFALKNRDRRRPLVSMPRQYQLMRLLPSVGRSIGGTSSDALLEYYCSEPPAWLWQSDVVDAFSSTLADRSLAMAKWLELSTMQTDGREFLRRSDQIQATRFMSRLPLAGRVAQVRHLVSSRPQSLPDVGREFMTTPPDAFSQLRQRVVANANAKPAVAAEQAKKSEAMACDLALRRIPLPATVPPRLTKALRVDEALPPRTAMLTFTMMGSRMYMTFTAEDETAFRMVKGASRLGTDVGRLLKAIGAGRSRGRRLPEDDRWRDEAIQLADKLFVDPIVLRSEQFDRIVVVPDGPLWYLPFELLPIGDRDGPLLGESTMVQYAPTPGLAIQPAAEPATLRTLGVAAGRFFAPADLDANQSKIESLMQALDPAVRLPSEPPVPGSLLGNQIGHLLVASARGMDPANPLEFSVASYDASSPQGSLKSWLRFPAASPRTVVLAGFRSAVASGKMGDGSEVFLTLCGLHAAGVREVMLSRWPVGGESTVIGVRELAQEVPFIGMAKGWQRARKILSQTELAPSEEPMLTKEESKLENLTGNEPFFWSSYLVSAALEKEGQP